jgi:DNA topoisomerase-6 subunit B
LFAGKTADAVSAEAEKIEPANANEGRKAAPIEGKSQSSTKPGGSGKSENRRETAETMATKQKEIAVSEFFAKNRHLLGFDNPRKALLTTVKEAVDNSLDACEEAEILPEIWIKIEALNGGSKAVESKGDAKNTSGDKNGKAKNQETQPSLIEVTNPELPQTVSPSIANATRFKVTVRDNGPGIVKAQIPNVFGRLLYGSKFHRLRMSRGQQGIGISAAGMYGLLTTGQSVEIISRTSKKKPAHRFELQMDTLKNRPEIIVDQEMETWIADGVEMEHGTEVSITLEAKFQRGRASVDEYLEQTAIANPHTAIHWMAPDGAQRDFPREVMEVPASPKAIKPHPYGVEMGVLIRMLKETEHKHLGAFLQEEFSRVSGKVAKEIVEKAGLSMNTWSAQVARDEADRLHDAIQQTKIIAPPTDCLVPIGPQQILKGLLKEIKAEFYTAETREPSVYRGNPFQIEVGLAFGGQLPADDSARVIRFANRVPLLYQPSACCITKSVIDTNWRNYGVSQPRNAVPDGPIVIFVHMASVWVPFTSESKEAIADYDEIRKEIKLAIQECGRKLNTYVRRRQRIAREGQRRNIFERYIGEVVMACEKMTKCDPAKLLAELQTVAKTRTATADLQFDEDGNPLKAAASAGRLDGDENVVVIESLQSETIAASEDEGSTGASATGATGKPGKSAELFGDTEAA